MVHQLSVGELRQWRDEGRDDYVLLDVREPWEITTCALEGSVNIPMGQVPNRLDELDRDRPLAVICHHGIRSQRVALFLQQAGFEDVYNVRGGINAWAKEIDPAMPTY